MANITTDQNFPNVVLSITDKDGKPAKVDGVPVWASSDATVIAAVAAADGMSGVVNTVAPSPLDAAGNPIPSRITVSADADLGAGVIPITGVSEDIIVIAGVLPASIMTLNLGAPAAKV